MNADVLKHNLTPYETVVLVRTSARAWCVALGISYDLLLSNDPLPRHYRQGFRDRSRKMIAEALIEQGFDWQDIAMAFGVTWRLASLRPGVELQRPEHPARLARPAAPTPPAPHASRVA